MTPSELSQLIASRRIYFDLVPDYELVQDKRVRVGHILNLFGAHARGPTPHPGDAESLKIFHDLEAVARSLVDTVGDTFDAVVGNFNGLLVDEPALKTDVVLLELMLRLNPGVSAPKEEASLRRLHDRCRELGLFEGAWKPSQAQAESP